MISEVSESGPLLGFEVDVSFESSDNKKSNQQEQLKQSIFVLRVLSNKDKADVILYFLTVNKPHGKTTHNVIIYPSYSAPSPPAPTEDINL